VASELVGAVPHQVSPWTGRFVNREDELAAVDRLVTVESPAVPRIAVFTGLPGVGKTLLTRKVAERHRDVFPGGELLVEFGDGRSVGDALGSCLVALGVAESVLPASAADRVGLFRTRTADRATLMVLDDVVDPAQVAPFVPSAPGSVVLVTSTARLSELRLDGAELVDVAPLDEDTGAQLLRELCGSRVDADPAAVRELVTVCGGLPVSLRAAASRLIRRSGRTVADLVEEIRSERGAGLSAGEAAVFSVIYQELSAEAATAYRTLGLLPGPTTTVRLVAAGQDVAEQVAGRLLEDLAEVGLATESADGRFGLHTVVRRHAVERGLAEDSAPERDAVLRRAMVDLVRQTAFADRAVLGRGRFRCTPHEQWLDGHDDPFSEDRSSALRWLDGQRATLAEAVRLCADHGWHDLTWQLAESATALYVNRRQLVDWTETSAAGARAAALAGQPAAEARLRSFVSRPWTDLGELTRARRELDRAFEAAAGVPDVRLMASIHEMDGRWRDASGDAAGAAAAFDRAVDLFRRVGDGRGAAFVTMFAGAARLRAGAVDDAISMLTAVLEQVREFGGSRMAGRAMITLGQACRAGGDDNRARTWLTEAVAELRASDEAFFEARAQVELAELLLATGDVAAARDCLRRARDLHVRLGSGADAELSRRLTELA
jgi:tetratricopeptide (TPR) repeat protein